MRHIQTHVWVCDCGEQTPLQDHISLPDNWHGTYRQGEYSDIQCPKCYQEKYEKDRASDVQAEEPIETIAQLLCAYDCCRNVDIWYRVFTRTRNEYRNRARTLLHDIQTKDEALSEKVAEAVRTIHHR